MNTTISISAESNIKLDVECISKIYEQMISQVRKEWKNPDFIAGSEFSIYTTFTSGNDTLYASLSKLYQDTVTEIICPKLNKIVEPYLASVRMFISESRKDGDEQSLMIDVDFDALSECSLNIASADKVIAA